MTRDEILRMAREAGFEQSMRHDRPGVTVLPDALFIRFAEMVATAEREACAQACEALKAGTLSSQSGDEHSLPNVMLRQVAFLGHGQCADAIRARSA